MFISPLFFNYLYMKIHIIGGGNLGSSLALGFYSFVKYCKIIVTQPDLDRIEYLKNDRISISSDNLKEIELADFVFITVKPINAEKVLKEILPHLKNQIVVSAVSGIKVQSLKSLINNATPVVRIMPNIAVKIGMSATCMSFAKGDEVSGEKVSRLLEMVGICETVDEDLMDGATVVGACGIAYALRYIRAAMQAGVEIGFDAEKSLRIAAQTVKGAAALAHDGKIHPEQLIDKVATPQGCTIVGLNEMEYQGFSSSLIKGMKKSLNSIKS